MANRYWYGGTANWDATAGSKWSDIDNVSGVGKSVPTSADDVFFTAGAGTVTVTRPTGAILNCLSLDCTGFTGTLALTGSIGVYKNLTLGSGMTTSGGGYLQLLATSGTWTITTNGKATGCGGMLFQGSGSTATYNLADDLSAKALNIYYGITFVTNNYNVFCTSTSLGFSTPGITLTLGTSTWTASTGIAILSSATITGGNFIANGNFNPNLQGITATTTNFEINGNCSLTNYSNTIKDLKINAGKTLKLYSGTTTTVTSLVSGGSLGSLAGLESTTAGSAATISDSSGTNTVSYMSIKDNTATGGATWDASDGTNTNVSGNTGWLFPATSSGNFFQFI